MTAGRPNIVVILTDQHRADAWQDGDGLPVLSPRLRELADRGTVFGETWCQSPVCQPSRASLITGRYPTDHGVVRNFASDFDPAWPSFMRRLQECGYRTANIGKAHYLGTRESARPGRRVHSDEWADRIAAFGFHDVLEEFDQHVHLKPGFGSPYLDHLERSGLRAAYEEMIRSVMPFTEGHWRGIESVLPEGFDQSDFLADAAVEWIDRTPANRPFFLQLSFVQPHSPLIASGRWAEHYAGVDVGAPRGDPPVGLTPEWEEHLADLRRRSRTGTMSPAELEKARRAYFGMVSVIDEGIGRVLAALKRRGVRDNTWIIYTSDHGEMLGDHALMGKACFYRASVRVPLIVTPAPSAGAEPRTDRGLAQLVDVGATVLDIAGADPIGGIRGRSLLPRVLGEESGGWPAAISEIGSYGPTDAVFRAVTDGTRRLTIDLLSGRASEVFDLENDPGETANLLGTSRGRVIEAELRELMAAEKLSDEVSEVHG
jgi:choline-sulfatase